MEPSGHGLDHVETDDGGSTPRPNSKLVHQTYKSANDYRLRLAIRLSNMATNVVQHHHPDPKLAQQIGHILWVSVIVSTSAFAFSMATLGVFSLWVLPAVYGCSIVHNITLLALSAKERKQSAETRKEGTFTATSKKASILCSSILGFLWSAVAGVVLARFITFSRDKFEHPYFYVTPWFEFAFALLEVGVIEFLGVQCVYERHRIIASDDATRCEFPHLGPKNIDL